MSTAVRPVHLERFSALITQRLGLQMPENRLDELVALLDRRVRESPTGAPDDYLAALARPGSAQEELRTLAVNLTVGETYFFRNADQFRALLGHLRPEARPPWPLRILSAGCATGEEPYSLAILLREHLGTQAAEVEVRAFDLNRESLGRARLGRYSSWSLRETSPEVRARYFRPEGKDHELDPEIRRMVTFEECNLADDDAPRWAPSSYDVIFCRNVLMYFAPEVMTAVVGRLSRALRPGGLLFLGHAETLRGISDAFHLVHTHGAFYYRRRSPDDPRPRPHPSPPAAAPEPSPVTWFEQIQRSAHRIEALATRGADPAPGARGAAGERPAPGAGSGPPHRDAPPGALRRRAGAAARPPARRQGPPRGPALPGGAAHQRRRPRRSRAAVPGAAAGGGAQRRRALLDRALQGQVRRPRRGRRAPRLRGLPRPRLRHAPPAPGLDRPPRRRPRHRPARAGPGRAAPGARGALAGAALRRRLQPGRAGRALPQRAARGRSPR